MSGPRITPKGIEYLQDNNMMKKAANFLKGVKDMTPGLVKTKTQRTAKGKPKAVFVCSFLGGDGMRVENQKTLPFA